MPKRISKLKDIVARSVTLKDSKGKTRIYMGVHDDPAYSSICLFGPRDRAIEISADHEGGLHVSLRDGTGKLIAGFGISSDDRIGISLFDHRSGSRMGVGFGWDRPATLYHRSPSWAHTMDNTQARAQENCPPQWLRPFQLKLRRPGGATPAWVLGDF